MKTIVPTEVQVQYEVQSAAANALRVNKLVKEQKKQVKLIKEKIDKHLSTLEDYNTAKKAVDNEKTKLDIVKRRALLNIQPLVDELKTAKSRLKVEQDTLSGWLQDHYKQTGQMSLFDTDEKVMLLVESKFKVKK